MEASVLCYSSLMLFQLRAAPGGIPLVLERGATDSHDLDDDDDEFMRTILSVRDSASAATTSTCFLAGSKKAARAR